MQFLVNESVMYQELSHGVQCTLIGMRSDYLFRHGSAHMVELNPTDDEREGLGLEML